MFLLSLEIPIFRWIPKYMDRSILEFRVKGIRLIYIITYTFNSLYERLEDSEEVSITRLQRQYRGQDKKDNRTNNHLQNITQKTKDRARRTSLKTMGEHRCSGRVCSSCSTCDTHRITLFTNPIYLPLLAKRGVANLHKHQSLDTSIFWCQPVLVFTPKVCIVSEKIQRFQRSSEYKCYSTLVWPERRSDTRSFQRDVSMLKVKPPR